MSQENLELLVTMDDPGEDTLEEDTFNHQTGNTVGHWPDQPQQVSDPTSKQK